MKSQSWKSRILGPLVISCVLCFAILDYTIYVETNRSPLSWLWIALAYIFENLPIFPYLAGTNLFWFGSIVILAICVVTVSLRQATKAMRVQVQITDHVISRTDEVIKAKPVFEFDAVGKWLITVQNPAVGTMSLNLKRDRTYEITKPAGALVAFSQMLGSSGNWLYSPMTGSLELIRENGTMQFPIQIAEKNNGNIIGQDSESTIYVFTRQ